jgi:DNA-binding response OmpR family regulator
MSERPTILICDDEVHILHVLSVKLRAAGYQTATFDRPQNALHFARTRPPALIITDYKMPGLTGVDLASVLRRETATRHVPIILLTAHGSCLPNPGRDHLAFEGLFAKPFSTRELLQQVHALLGEPATENQP